MRKALTIAGSDSGGGAGVQADLKTFHQHRVFGMSAITLITAQNTLGVHALLLLPVELVLAQIEAVATDLAPDAVKTGALGSAAMVERVAWAAGRWGLVPLVVDPVMISKHGSPLLADDAVDALKRHLFPRATLVTPNVPEAEALLGTRLETDRDMEEAARALVGMGARAAVVKGGHRMVGDGREAVDIFFDGARVERLEAPRVHSLHTHGTGCTFSAAIAANLAQGDALDVAVRRAKAYVTAAIVAAPGFGAGHGPLDHFASIDGGR
jgi:hydroxymethylpyrimidine/phosphomethylpyrimidine kinase